MLTSAVRLAVSAVTLGLAASLATPAGAELLAHKDLSLDTAVTIATTAAATCKERGYRVSVHVVGRGGEVLVALRGDNASPHTFENSMRKAYTARTFQRPSAETAKQLESGNAVVRQQVTLPNVIAIPGGVPIKVGNDTIGGVGLSGSPGVDEPCVQAGLDKVKDQLK